MRAPRVIPGALILLLHVVMAIALLRHGAARTDVDDTPADYIAFAFIPAPAKQVTEAARSAPLPAVVPPVRARRASPQPTITVPDTRAFDAPVAAVPAPPATLDMAALRKAAREVDSARAPTERARDTGKLQALDDTPLARAVREAKRPDCQTKYSGGTKLDLVRLIPLAIDTITDTGCQW